MTISQDAKHFCLLESTKDPGWKGYFLIVPGTGCTRWNLDDKFFRQTKEPIVAVKCNMSNMLDISGPSNFECFWGIFFHSLTRSHERSSYCIQKHGNNGELSSFSLLLLLMLFMCTTVPSLTSCWLSPAPAPVAAAVVIRASGAAGHIISAISCATEKPTSSSWTWPSSRAGSSRDKDQRRSCIGTVAALVVSVGNA